MPSAKVLTKKKEIVSSLAERFSGAQTIVLVDYRGITVEQDTELRAATRKAGVEYKVIKNSLAKFAMKEINISGVDEYLEGPTAIAYSNDDMIAPARIMNEYSKKIKALEIKAGIVEGKVLAADEIKAIASLPSKEALIASVLGGLNAPISGFVNVLNANITGLVRVLSAISEKSED